MSVQSIQTCDSAVSIHIYPCMLFENKLLCKVFDLQQVLLALWASHLDILS